MIAVSAEVGRGCEVKERRQQKGAGVFYALSPFLLIHTHTEIKQKLSPPFTGGRDLQREGFSCQNKIPKLSLTGTVCA